MDAALLRNLGVNEAIIQALQKSYGEEQAEMEILPDKHDLKLVLKRKSLENLKPHILTFPGFFKVKPVLQKAEPGTEIPNESYQCEDTFEFLPESEAAKENLKINGVGIRLSDSLLKLLKYFAQKMVDTKTGWAYIQDMRVEGVIPSDGYQSFSRLRSDINGYLLKKNAKDLIEANGRKQYRLSVDPTNIKMPMEIK
jgi:hypothetical protein